MPGPLWSPSTTRVASARLTTFRRDLEASAGIRLADYSALHRYSVEFPDRFWRAFWQGAGIRADGNTARVVEDPRQMRGAQFFPDVRLNFTENVLRQRDQGDAILFRNERGVVRRITNAELYREVAAAAAALRDAGVEPGDRVAGYMPNLPETVVAALAAAAVGAIWSSTSADFGSRGVVDRFGQIEPKVLIAADGYWYGGRPHDRLAEIREIAASLPTVERLVVVPYLDDEARIAQLTSATSWRRFVDRATAAEIPFERLPFNHPLYILYSSGTTGVPKCIVHGAGGTLIQHLKEHQLHCDVRSGDRVFYFTTCGWMMWNWLVTALASEATILLYDGSPVHPTPSVLFDFADEAGMTLFGTSAKYIDALQKAGMGPIETHALTSLRTITSTGSPLAPASFDYVYQRVKADVHLASISGGTDIVSCFVLGDPTAPVWAGEIQAAGLGMAVDVFDASGQPISGEKGELVCTRPFPSMPVAFWNDPGGRKYRAAYFEKFPGVWAHGDYAERTEHDGFVIYGRSDAVLNPGGVRIGTAEIYRQVEQVPDVVESLAVGQQWEGDERIILFVKLRPGLTLDDGLRETIGRQIRQNATPRHVPARIVQVTDIPRTRSGKIVELAVRDVVHGREVRNTEALANPEALEEFRDRPELRT
jgi:acetoacetyl-CoA synthetase